jgi:integrase/recombinase XerD
MGKPAGKVARMLAAGPLGSFADAYRERLTGRGYAPVIASKHVIHLGHLSRWLEVHGVGPADLTRDRLGQFVAARQALTGHRGCSLQGLLPVLEILEERGVIWAPRPPRPVSAAEVIAGSFGCYLAAERGASATTVDAYVPRARRFVAAYAPGGDVGALTPAIVTRAVLAESAAVSAASAQVFVRALRAFLHFCFVEGLTGTDLATAALMMPGARRSCLPRGISSSDAGCLLRSCDRRTAGGRRDYAVILTLLRLGLRAGEVAGMRLDDIDWRSGELVVRGKGDHVDRLPLVAEVGIVEPGDGAQQPSHGRAGPGAGFEFPGKAFDVGAADGEQGKRPGAAPAGELAQVQRVRLAGQAAESGQGEPFWIGEGGLDRGDRG